MFTKKHFEAISDAIHSNLNIIAYDTDFGNGYEVGSRTASESIAKELAKVFVESNPHFDTIRFFKACGIDKS